ncbi:transposable element Tcb1 transposase [Trichonephila clavipes]|nr:transposable element Tcb1 transposase [Trichonephila clavipes]
MCWNRWIREISQKPGSGRPQRTSRQEDPHIQHTTPTVGWMVWSDIAYNTRSPLVLIRVTMTTLRYVRDILQQHVLPCNASQESFFNRLDNSWLHTRVLQDCL